MTYSREGRTYNIPDTELEKLMKALDIDKVEAAALYVDDLEDEMTEEQKELEAKAAKIKRYERAAIKKAERKPKERKVDTEKGSLLAVIREALEEVEGLTITGQKTETELTFGLNGEDYTVKLTRHRKKK